MKSIMKICIPILILSIAIPTITMEIQFASANPPPRYYGSVDFNGTVYLNWSSEAVSNVKVQLLEDGSAKRTDYTDSNGYYEFTWTVQQYKFYSISIEKDGYKYGDKSVMPTSADHEEDLTLKGKAALFMWAPDVANTTIIDELRDDLIYNESFTDILYYENATDWEDAIEDLDTYVGPSSLAFVYVIAHGDYSTVYINNQYENRSNVYYQGGSSEEKFHSNEFVDKLLELDASDTIFLVESCYSGDFTGEYKKQSHYQDDVFGMSSANFTQAARWYGVNGSRYNQSDETGNQGAWGGAFTHFFFEGLHNGYDEEDAFDYARDEAYSYALAVIGPDDLYQNATNYDGLSTRWL